MLDTGVECEQRCGDKLAKFRPRVLSVPTNQPSQEARSKLLIAATDMLDQILESVPTPARCPDPPQLPTTQGRPTPLRRPTTLGCPTPLRRPTTPGRPPPLQLPTTLGCPTTLQRSRALDFPIAQRLVQALLQRDLVALQPFSIVQVLPSLC